MYFNDKPDMVTTMNSPFDGGGAMKVSIVADQHQLPALTTASQTKNHTFAEIGFQLD